MKKNIGKTDRILRILLSLLVVILYFTGVISGTAGVVLLVLAGVLLVTAITGFCGIYTLFGFSTCKTEVKG